MTKHFEGLTAVVSGAGSGIGLSVAQQLHAMGVKVFGLDVNVGAMAPYATYIHCNIGDTSSVKSAFERISTEIQSLDILINNAGIGAIGSIEDATDEEWASVMNINVVGISRVSTAALPLLRMSKSASIVNTCSVAATVGLPKRAVYSASKGAVLSLTRAMAADLIVDRIRVNCVNPGTADTPWVGRILGQASDPVAEKAALAARQPIGRLVSADEVASAILYLASPEQASTTGIALTVDGGLQALRLPK